MFPDLIVLSAAKMAEFKTPTSNKFRSRTTDNSELQTPVKIPATPFLKQIGYGTGVNVFTLERSPKVGFTRSPWALKKRNKKIANGQLYDDRIRFEAEVLRKLDHPNIVGFRGYAESSVSGPCLVMEQLESSLGNVLEDRLDEGGEPLPATTILKIAYEVAKGLEYLHHTARILHGDVKSYNVLVSNDCQTAKLCDFGVSVPLTETLELDTSKGKFSYVGTEHWSAPEILFDNGPVTNKADIWSYGLVIWEMIALSPPGIDSEDFMDDSNADISLLETNATSEKENCNSAANTNDSVVFLQEVKNSKCGTRPALPAIELGQEYDKVLEVFYACTTADYSLRPSANDLVGFFCRYIYCEK